jgi:hypothetical protein
MKYLVTLFGLVALGGIASCLVILGAVIWHAAFMGAAPPFHGPYGQAFVIGLFVFVTGCIGAAISLLLEDRL